MSDKPASDMVSARARRIINAIRELPQEAEWDDSPSLDQAICDYVAVLKNENVPSAQAAVILERAIETSSGARELSLDQKAVLARCLHKYYDFPIP